jgi:group I intron endonuclease
MGCGIYKIENLKNGKIYIGSSIDVKSREYKHFWMLDKSRHDNEYLQKSYNKHGKKCFKFDVIEECLIEELISKENYYINLYTSNKQDKGYNLATVNEFRRNNFNDIVKKKISQYNLTKNGNFTIFSLRSIETGEEQIFNSLIDAAEYLILGGYAKGIQRNVRIKISNCLRGIKVNNGSPNGSIRKTCYKHTFKIIK